jgi:hypothetical protein
MKISSSGDNGCAPPLRFLSWKGIGYSGASMIQILCSLLPLFSNQGVLLGGLVSGSLFLSIRRSSGGCFGMLFGWFYCWISCDTFG